MSTCTGQSPVQPLHDRHRSSDSLTASSRQPSVIGSPLSISNSSRERPRVEWRSSRVTWKLGHMVRLPEVAALGHPEAALDRGGERAAVVREREVGGEPGRAVVGAEAQALVELDVADQPVRVHLPVRIPDPLEVVERGHQLGAEHLREQLGAAVALAVLAGERAAVGDDQVGALLHERAERLDPWRGLEVEVHPRVYTALAEVAVVDAAVAVVVEDLLEVAQVGAELVRVDGRVLPVALGVHVAGRAAVADRALAHLPDADLVGLVDDHAGVDLGPVREVLERLRARSAMASSGSSWPNST